MVFLEVTTGTPSINEAVLWSIIASPLVAWGLIALYARKMPATAGYLAILGIGVSLALSYVTLFNVIDAGGGIATYTHEWLVIGDLTANLGVRVDGLTAIMLVVVTSVSLLVQVYSQGYMKGDPGYGRYFAHMSIFTTSMLGLVLADNLFMMFIFWELVGLSSYLLIGFWFHKPSAAAAAKKAFIVTRIGDLGFLAALVLVWRELGTFDIAAIHEAVISGELNGQLLTLFGLGLFAGAAGKSAQFPLHVWLPDAMEGPTPVSALIHAATMVAAGVYLIARFFPVFEYSPDAAQVVAWVGGATALIAATIAVVQTDFKRVLAYSTISQLGYMMLALGLFGYAAAIFHLFTHAFFKALLFLGSGSVNHATNTFDMRKMGGLRKAMPVTFWTFIVGSLSLAGIFPLAGFWSKDEILLDAWNENRGLYIIGASVAFLTAFYMFRAIFLTFFGEYKGGEPVDHEDEDSHFHGDPAQPHESPWTMALPLVILAVPAIGAGLFAFGGLGGNFTDFVNGALPEGGHAAPNFHWGIALSSSALAVGGIAVAYAIYYKKWVASSEIRATALPIATVLEHKYFLDWLYEDVFVIRIFQRMLNRLVELFDTYIVDGLINGMARLLGRLSRELKVVQSGQIQLYGIGIILGVVVVVITIYSANPL